MLITMLADRFDAGGVLRARGTQVDVATDLALLWIGAGVAAPVGNARELAQGLRRDVAVVQDQVSGQQFAGQGVVSGAGNNKSKKAPFAAVGGANPLALSDITAIAGSPTITLETGPNGLPALKIVTGVGATTEVTFPALNGSRFDGDIYLSWDCSRTLSNLDYAVMLVSQDDATYAKGTNTVINYGQTAPQDSYIEQGGTNTYWWRKSGQGNLASAPTYPVTVGQMKFRIVPLAGQRVTAYIYAVGFAAPPAKGRICVTWDDGYDSMFKLGYDLFASRGIKQTLSVIGSAQDTGGSYSYTSQLRAFLDAGNALVAHGPWPNQGAGNLWSAYNGTGDSNAVANAVADMQRNRQWLSDRGLLVPGADKCYIWPQGSFQRSVNDTALLNAALAAGFTLARGTSNVAGSALHPHGVQIDALSRYNRLACPIIGHLWAGTTAAEATNITTITTAISNLATSKGDAFLMLHRVLPTGTNDAGMGAASNITIRQSDLDTIAAAIKTQIDAGTLEAVTMPELASSPAWASY